MQALKIYRHGPASELAASDVEAPILGLDDVLVQVLAAGINPSDVGSAGGRFAEAPLPRILGRDFAGKVVDGPAGLIGSNVWGSGGDLGITRDGTHAEYVAIPAKAVVTIPPSLTLDQAAMAGVPYVTAWTSLVHRADLKAGEWVIISGAAGAVGSAATQIASAIGANIIALVKRSEDDDRIDHSAVKAIAHSEEGDLKEVVDEFTKGKGADVVVNGVGASLFQPLMDGLSEFGRYVLYSVLGGREVTVDLMQVYRKNVTIHGVNTVAVTVSDAANILRDLSPMIQSGRIKLPAVQRRFPLSQAATAYGTISEGKTVLIPDRLFQIDG